jgi:hypothetical protein
MCVFYLTRGRVRAGDDPRAAPARAGRVELQQDGDQRVGRVLEQVGVVCVKAAAAAVPT